MPHYLGTINAQHPKAGQYINSGFFNGLKSLTELNERISALPTTKDQGDAFEVFVEAYLAVKRQNDFKAIWPEKKIPYSVRKELNIPNDRGIDGVCLNHLGTYDSYQVKWRGLGHVLNLPYNEAANLYSQSDSPKIRIEIPDHKLL